MQAPELLGTGGRLQVVLPLKHDEATGHPLMRSFEPGEHWGWCYVDALEIDPRPPPPVEPARPSVHAS
ncbi:hypothetical protein [Archangium violaceum]|uniref:hypothetical protein n=1 Tax=Archangium violaceum TaxID=83451 RepID=UPI00126A242C|nr:hypothetical protein [Archangium violaceum]